MIFLQVTVDNVVNAFWRFSFISTHFCSLCISQVVRKQTLGEVGNLTVIWWPAVSGWTLAVAVPWWPHHKHCRFLLLLVLLLLLLVLILLILLWYYCCYYYYYYYYYYCCCFYYHTTNKQVELTEPSLEVGIFCIFGRACIFSLLSLRN